MSNRLFLSILLITISAVNQASDQACIFVDKPDLTWQKFEQQLRAKYPDLAMPAIKEINDVSAFFRDKDSDIEVGLREALQHSPAVYVCDEDMFVYSADWIKRIEMSSQSLEVIMLHECGHYFYSKDKRKVNEAKAQQVLTDYWQTKKQVNEARIFATLLAAGANLEHLRIRGRNNLLLTCGILLNEPVSYLSAKLMDRRAMVRARREQTRPEEIAADQFAFERSSTESLKSFDKDLLSQEASLKMLKVAQDKLLLDIPDSYKAFRRRIFKIDQFLVKVHYNYPVMHDLVDPEHPAHRDRSAVLHKELQRRGEQ